MVSLEKELRQVIRKVGRVEKGIESIERRMEVARIAKDWKELRRLHSKKLRLQKLEVLVLEKKVLLREKKVLLLRNLELARQMTTPPGEKR